MNYRLTITSAIVLLLTFGGQATAGPAGRGTGRYGACRGDMCCGCRPGRGGGAPAGQLGTLVRRRTPEWTLRHHRPRRAGVGAPGHRAPAESRAGRCPSPCPVALPEATASRIDLGRRDLSRRARGAPAPRVSGSGAGPRNAQGSPSARMILRAISPASLWPARDRHGNSPIVAMAIRRGIYRGMRDRRRTVRRGPLSGSIARCPPRRRRSAPTHRKRSLPCSRARPAGPLARRRPARS